MNINRKTKESKKIEIRDIECGACFLYGSPEELYIRTEGDYNTDPYYVISAIRLRDGFENRFKATAMAQPVGATINVEE